MRHYLILNRVLNERSGCKKLVLIFFEDSQLVIPFQSYVKALPQVLYVKTKHINKCDALAALFFLRNTIYGNYCSTIVIPCFEQGTVTSAYFNLTSVTQITTHT